MGGEWYLLGTCVVLFVFVQIVLHVAKKRKNAAKEEKRGEDAVVNTISNLERSTDTAKEEKRGEDTVQPMEQSCQIPVNQGDADRKIQVFVGGGVLSLPRDPRLDMVKRK